MEVRSSDAKAPELLGVIVLIERPAQECAESQSFLGNLSQSQRDRAASELRRIADAVEEAPIRSGL
jgi:hypothetical protein